MEVDVRFNVCFRTEQKQHGSVLKILRKSPKIKFMRLCIERTYSSAALQGTSPEAHSVDTKHEDVRLIFSVCMRSTSLRSPRIQMNGGKLLFGAIPSKLVQNL